MLGSNAKEQIQLVYLLVFSTRNESNHPSLWAQILHYSSLSYIFNEPLGMDARGDKLQT